MVLVFSVICRNEEGNVRELEGSSQIVLKTVLDTAAAKEEVRGVATVALSCRCEWRPTW